MGIVGKIVGGTIGFALGGPLGALAGAAFGHALDSGDNELPENKSPYLSTLDESRLAFFASTFSMLAKVAQADGRVSNEEIKTIEAFAAQDLGLSTPERQVALNIFRTALESPARFEDFAMQFHRRFQQHPQMLEMIIDILLRVSVADGPPTMAQETLILHAVHVFRWNEWQYQRIKAKYRVSEDQNYRLLGCRPEDSNEVIKSHYRKLVQTYHPDKLAGKGLPDEFIRLAHEKFHQIQSAYEHIRRQRGLK